MSESSLVVPECPDGLVVDLKVRQGVWLSKGQVVAILKRPKSTEKVENPKPDVLIKVRAEHNGKVVEVFKKNGDCVKPG
jgi:biotin carboxyl carrier protein